MKRMEAVFRRCKEENRAALIGYLTAGDPDRARSLRAIRTALAHGVDILELGVPFSDPTADGPVIQAASQRALAAGMTLAKALAMVRTIRSWSQAPIILFGYANPFFAYGYEALARSARRSGVDGLLVVDMPMEEAGEMRGALDACGLAMIPLIAPTTSMERAAAILREAKGFVYYIMVKGVTGVRRTLASDAAAHLAALRRVTALPVAAGFGISTPAQARHCARLADGIVVGSAMVAAARNRQLAKFVRQLRGALGKHPAASCVRPDYLPRKRFISRRISSRTWKSVAR